MLPVRRTDVLVISTGFIWDKLTDGALTGLVEPVVLAGRPAPAEFTALTRKLCVTFGANPFTVCDVLVTPCTVVHEPLLTDTSYLDIGPPGADQVRVTELAPGVVLRFSGAPGTVGGGARVVTGIAGLCHDPDCPAVLATART